MDELLELFLAKRDPERRAMQEKALERIPVERALAEPSRRIPQRVKDEVWLRDGARCVQVLADGSRCPEREGLEFDHIIPWALGGTSRHAGNIRLLCRGHNQLRARRAVDDMPNIYL